MLNQLPRHVRVRCSSAAAWPWFLFLLLSRWDNINSRSNTTNRNNTNSNYDNIDISSNNNNGDVKMLVRLIFSRFSSTSFFRKPKSVSLCSSFVLFVCSQNYLKLLLGSCTICYIHVLFLSSFHAECSFVNMFTFAQIEIFLRWMFYSLRFWLWPLNMTLNLQPYTYNSLQVL